MTPKEQHPEHTRPANKESTVAPTIHLPVRERSAYDVEGELARGGLGRVLRAKDQCLGRVVALKETLRDDNDIKERFLREALLTARLQHPSIVPIYEAGVWPSGEPFYAMKLISGKPLSDAVQERGSLQERLSLLPNLLAVCEALSYAHTKNVIHRDLKPQNILIGEFGETVVIDWGLAKELSPAHHSSIKHGQAQPQVESELTVAGAIIGTPAYMPPEQARGFAVDERADVYSLGAILYFLLSGNPPYQGKISTDVIERVITKPPIPLSEHEENIPHDLLAIVQKAMSRDLELRYPSAKELADDLKKYLNGQLVGAYRYSSSELFRRWVGRYRGAISIAALLLLIAIGSLAYSFYRVNQARRDAEDARALAEEREQEALQQKQDADSARLDAEQQKQTTIAQSDQNLFLSARIVLEKNPRQALQFLSDLSPNFQQNNALRLLVADALSRGDSKILPNKKWESFVYSSDKRLILFGDAKENLHLWDLPCLLSAQSSGCTAEKLLIGPTGAMFSYLFLTVDEKPSLLTGHLNGELWLWDLQSAEGLPLVGHEEIITYLACLSNEPRCFSSSADGTVRSWDLRTTTGSLLLETNQELAYVFLSADEETLYASSKETGSHFALSLKTGERHEDIQTEPSVASVSSDHRWFACANSDHTITLTDLNSGAARTLRGHTSPISKMFFSWDAKRLLSYDSAHRIFLWDATTTKAIELKGHTRAINYVVFSPTGDTLVTNEEGALFFWDVPTGKLLEKRNDSQFTHMRFSPDGKLFAYPGPENTVRLWSRSDSHVLLGHQNQVVRVEFSPSGRHLASTGYDGVVRVWDMQTPSTASRWALYGHVDEVLQLFWFDEQTLLSSGFADETVRVWRLTQQEGSVVEGADKNNPTLAISPDKGAIAFSKTNNVQYCQITRALLCRDLPGDISRVSRITFSPDGNLLLAASEEGTIRVWSLISQESFVLTAHPSPILYATFSWNNAQIASISADSTLLLWDLKTRSKESQITLEGVAPHFLLFSPDDQFIFASGQDWWRSLKLRDEKGYGFLWLWEPSTGASRKYFSQHSYLRDMLWSPDQKSLMTSGEDMKIRRWELSCLTSHLKSEEVAPCSPREFIGHRGRIYQMRFSPDGRSLATAGDDNTLRLWDYESGETTQIFRGHTHSVVSVDFSADGALLVSGSLDGTVRIWDPITGESRALRGHQDMVTRSVFTAKDSAVSIAFDGSVRLWNDDLPKDPAKLREWLHALVSQDPSATGPNHPTW